MRHTDPAKLVDQPQPADPARPTDPTDAANPTGPAISAGPVDRLELADTANPAGPANSAQPRRRLNWHWQGRVMVATGVLHTIVGIVVFWDGLGQSAKDGVIATAPKSAENNSVTWFLVAGLFLMLFGGLIHHLNTALDRPAPASIGWGLIGLSALGLVMMPGSGFWLLLAQGIWYVAAARQGPVER